MAVTCRGRVAAERGRAPGGTRILRKDRLDRERPLSAIRLAGTTKAGFCFGGAAPATIGARRARLHGAPGQPHPAVSCRGPFPVDGHPPCPSCDGPPSLCSSARR
jgi:hypothetical protein